MLILEDLIEAEIDIWDERAAIREYDGNMPRNDAERMALKDIERRRVNESKGCDRTRKARHAAGAALSEPIG